MNGFEISAYVPEGGSAPDGSLAPAQLMSVVSATWDRYVTSHPEGLTDPKLTKKREQLALSQTEASYHYAASKAGVVDSARFLLAFGVAPSIALTPRAYREEDIGPASAMTAIVLNDLKKLTDLLEKYPGAENYVRELDGVTPLQLCASLPGRLPLLELLLKSGSSLEIKARHGATAAMIAAARDDEETLRLLLKHGADPAARHAFANTTALHFAAEVGALRTIPLLCESLPQACSLRTSPAKGTPLHTAIDSNRLDSVKVLLQPPCSCEMGALMHDDTGVVYLAAQRAHDHVLRHLLEQRADANYVMPDVYVTPTSKSVVASETGNQHIPYDYTSKNSEMANGATALHVASENGHLSTVQVLLAHAETKQLASMRGTTPLLLALQYQHEDIALELMKHTCNPTYVNKRADTSAFPLFVAAGYGYAKAVRQLVACGAKINARNAAGASSLSHAAFRSRKLLVRWFLDQPDIQVTEMELEAALTQESIDPAQEDDAEVVLRSLIDHLGISSKASLTTMLSETVRSIKVPNLVELLTERGASAVEPNATTGRTALIDKAHSGGSLRVFRALLAHARKTPGGVNRPAASSDEFNGVTALYAAVDAANVAFVDLLLNKGDADPNIGPPFPLTTAAERGHVVIVRALLAKGARPGFDAALRAYRFPDVLTALLDSPNMPQLNPQEVERLYQTVCAKRRREANETDSVAETLRALGRRLPPTPETRAACATELVLGQALKESQRPHEQVVQAVRELLSSSSSSKNSEVSEKLWSHLMSRTPNVFHACGLAYSFETEADKEDAALELLGLVLATRDDRALPGAASGHLAKSGYTPLLIAIETRRAKILEVLLRIDPDSVGVAAKDTNELPIETARRVRHLESLALVDAAWRRRGGRDET